MRPAWLAGTELRAQAGTRPPSRAAGHCDTLSRGPSRPSCPRGCSLKPHPGCVASTWPRGQCLVPKSGFVPSEAMCSSRARREAESHVRPCPGSVSQALHLPPGPGAEPLPGAPMRDPCLKGFLPGKSARISKEQSSAPESTTYRGAWMRGEPRLSLSNCCL